MNKRIFFLILFLLLLFLWYRLLDVKFFQDDYFILNKVLGFSVKDFLSLFLPDRRVMYYRPLGVDIYFWLGKTIFGLQPILFHIVAFAVHCLNAYLVYLLAKKLSKNETVAFLTSFIWSTSAIHFLSLVWASNFSYILVSFFSFLTMTLWLSGRRKTAYLTFLLAMLSNELAIVVPIILAVFDFQGEMKISLRKIVRLLPFAVVVIFYTAIRFLLPGTYGGVYAWQFNARIFSTLRWYLLWSFGWAETMSTQMNSTFSIRDIFYIGFTRESLVYINSLSITICILVLFPCLLLIADFRKGMKFISKNIIFLFTGIVTFFIGILPVLFLPDHTYPHYLTIAGFSLYFMLSYFFVRVCTCFKVDKRIFYTFTGIFMISWIIVSLTTITLNQKTHWTLRHAAMAEELIGKIKNNTLEINKGAGIVYISAPSGDREVSMSGENAVKVILNKTWQTIYLKPAELQRVMEENYNESEHGTLCKDLRRGCIFI